MGRRLQGREFQSPRNRVKCSDPAMSETVIRGFLSFNPLEIGSSVLMNPFWRTKRLLRWCFNPLEIGSSVLMHGDV